MGQGNRTLADQHSFKVGLIPCCSLCLAPDACLGFLLFDDVGALSIRMRLGSSFRVNVVEAVCYPPVISKRQSAGFFAEPARLLMKYLVSTLTFSPILGCDSVFVGVGFYSYLAKRHIIFNCLRRDYVKCLLSHGRIEAVANSLAVKGLHISESQIIVHIAMKRMSISRCFLA